MYSFLNANPDGRRENDCVCRAICTALGLKYSVVEKLLKLSAKANGCDELCVSCYRNLLEDVFDLDVIYIDFRATGNEVAKEFQDNVILMRMDGHLTCAV